MANPKRAVSRKPTPSSSYSVEAVPIRPSFAPPPVHVKIKRLCGSNRRYRAMTDIFFIFFSVSLPFIIYYLLTFH